jgi:phosphoglycerol transferase MdoB-like AlkP superfamily enzyme
MSLEAIWTWIGDSELAFQIGATWWFPLLESIHVLTITFLIGAIIMVDFRLLGWTARHYRISQFVDELTPWAWAALVPAIITGFGLFISRPAAYAANPAFQIKMLLLMLAGLNVFVFHRILYTPVAAADAPAQSAAWAQRCAGAASLLIWLGVILSGRWVGHLN